MSVTSTAPVVGFPLSPQQRRVWALGAEEAAYRAQGLVIIDGPLDVVKLEATLRQLVREHEICRTRIAPAPVSGVPVQLIDEVGDVPIRRCDLRGSSAGEQTARLEELFREAGEDPFDPAHGPLLRWDIVVLSPERHCLAVAWSALCADRAALRQLLHESARAYGGPEPSSVSPSPGEGAMQYADIAAWANELLEAEDGEAGRSPWRRQRVPDWEGLRLPLASEPPSDRSFQPHKVEFAIGVAETSRMEQLAANWGVDLSTVLLACFHALLWRLTDVQEVVIGAVFDGRRHEELTRALGPLARYLPVPCRLAASARFHEVLSRVHEAVEEIGRRQEFFAWELLEGWPGRPPREPLLPFLFDFAEELPRVSVGDVSFGLEREHVCTERSHVRLSCLRRAAGLRAELFFDPGYIRVEDAERLAGEFQSVVRQAIAEPRAKIGNWDVLGDGERQALLVGFNETGTSYPRGTCIHHLIEERARQATSVPAVLFEGQTLSYGNLNDRADRLARRLRSLGVGPEVLVAVCLERSLEMVVALLAVLKAGGAYVPLDPQYPPERLAFMLEDTGAKVLLTVRRLLPGMPAHGARLICLDDAVEAAGEEESETQVASPVTPANLVYVIYTSGSTGRPKGVMVSHEGLVISQSARAAYFDQDVERFLLLSPLAFDSSVVGIYWTLCTGGTLVLVPEEVQQNLAQLADVIAAERITHLLTLPSFYALVLEHASPEQLASLRTVIVAGEPCPKRLVDLHHERLPEIGLYSEYGATETTVWSSVYECRGQELLVAPIGRPIANAQVYVLDPRLNPTPIGVAGEVYFGGEGLARGYWGRSDLTAERFVPDPFSGRPGARLYRSGDLARPLPSGDVEFLGRIDNQVKIRGYRIELEEIGAVLADHPSLKEAVVVAQDGDRSQGKRLVAYLVPRGSEPLSVKEVRSFLAQRLPGFMVPSAFVFLDALPRNPNGKIDRRALPASGSTRPELDNEFAAPRTAVEKALAEVWAEVLGLERVGVHDNFFELGGDSILSIQVAARANQRGLRVTPLQLFQRQTVVELAAVAETARARPSESGPVTGDVPLTPVQRWFFELDLPVPEHWNMPVLLEVRPGLDPSVAGEAIAGLLEHHDALRLRFRREGSSWRQTIAPPGGAVAFSRVDLTDVAAGEEEAAIETAAAEWQASLDLSEGPLLRAVWLDIEQGRPPRLLLIAHHLVVDGVSWRILLEDLQAAIQQRLRGEDVLLPAKTTSFKEWALRLQEHARSKALREELPYWLSADRADVAPLPLDHPGGANTEASARRVSVHLTPDETRALLQEVPKAYRSRINDALLTAFLMALSRWTGRRSLLVNLEGHGREEIVEGMDLSRTVGWFTADFPVLLHLPPRSGPGESILAVKEQLRRVPHQGIGYGVLRYLGGDEAVAQRLRRLPQPEVALNYLGQFDQAFSGESCFTLSRQTSGPSQAPAGRRPFALEVYGLVLAGQLSIEWEYSENLLERDTVAALANDFVAELRSLIAHCLSIGPGSEVALDLGPFDWSRRDLEEIAAAIRRSQEGA